MSTDGNKEGPQHTPRPQWQKGKAAGSKDTPVPRWVKGATTGTQYEPFVSGKGKKK